MANGEQAGPISAEELQQYAAAGYIHAETEVWTDGLDQWVPATHVEGLVFGQPEPAPQTSGPRLIVGAAAQAAHPLAGEITPQTAQPVQPVQPVAAAVQPMVAQPQVAGLQQPGMQPAMTPGFGMVPAVQPGEEYPLTGTKGASYGLLLSFMLGGFSLGILGIVMVFSTAPSAPSEEIGSGGMLGMAFVGIGFILMFCTGILSYIYLYRAWSCLRFGAPRTTPGKAIGFLFIPIFSIYWIFVAFYGLSQDWNRVMGSHPNLQGGPRMSEGMFLAYLICILVAGPVALIFWFIIFKQICDGINFMAAQAMRQSRPAGMTFY